MGRPWSNRSIFWALPEYCRIAIETLTYLTDLHFWKVCAVASAASRRIHAPFSRGSITPPGYLSVAISVWVYVVGAGVGSDEPSWVAPTHHDRG
jgi:hypothetical protein